jgi:hypothetical protein
VKSSGITKITNLVVATFMDEMELFYIYAFNKVGEWLYFSFSSDNAFCNSSMARSFLPTVL